MLLRKLLILLGLCILGVLLVERTQAQDLSATQYKAVRLSWKANPPAEQVGFYVVQFNDEGLSDDTWVELDATSNTEIVFSFTRLIEIAGRTNNNLLTLDDQLCLRILAGRGGERSAPSDPACFTLRGTDKPPVTNTPDDLTPPIDLTFSLVK